VLSRALSPIPEKLPGYGDAVATLAEKGGSFLPVQKTLIVIARHVSLAMNSRTTPEREGIGSVKKPER
jgi:hypothetical protein